MSNELVQVALLYVLDLVAVGQVQTVQVIVAHIISPGHSRTPAKPDGTVLDGFFLINEGACTHRA